MKNTTPILLGIASPDKVETRLGILKNWPCAREANSVPPMKD
jgi:hypothetical protein